MNETNWIVCDLGEFFDLAEVCDTCEFTEEPCDFSVVDGIECVAGGDWVATGVAGWPVSLILCVYLGNVEIGMKNILISILYDSDLVREWS